MTFCLLCQNCIKKLWPPKLTPSWICLLIGTLGCELSCLREHEIRWWWHCCPLTSGLGRSKQCWGRRTYPQESQTQHLSWKSTLAGFRVGEVIAHRLICWGRMLLLQPRIKEVLGLFHNLWSERVATKGSQDDGSNWRDFWINVSDYTLCMQHTINIPEV